MIEETLHFIDHLHVKKISYTEQPVGYLLYIHGGPGSHSGYFEEVIKNSKAYQSNFPFGWICYDQRNCGRSKSVSSAVCHEDNIRDLEKLCSALKKNNIEIKALIGHSYGARLAYQYCQSCHSSIKKLILLGRAEKGSWSYKRSILMDLLILKMTQANIYQDLLPELKNFDEPSYELRNVIREKMTNPDDRKYYYWGNLEAMQNYENIKKNCPFQDNDQTFHEVISTFPKDQSFQQFDLTKIDQDVLWINGLHDFLMAGELFFGDNHPYITTYTNSGHYPHIEEPEHFANDLKNFVLNA